MKRELNVLFIMGIEFFNDMAIGLKGPLRPFNDERYPELQVSHKPGKISVTVGDRPALILNEDDTLKIDTIEKEVYVVFGPSHYTDRWKKAVATTILKKSVLEFSTDPIFVPKGYTAVVFDSNRSVTDREGVIYHEPGRMIYDREVVVLFDVHDNVEKIYVRSKKNVNALAWVEKFFAKHGLVQQPSGAFDHIANSAAEIRRAKNELAMQNKNRTLEIFRLVDRLKVRDPMMLELKGKKFTVRDGIIYPGFKVGGKKIDRESAFDSGLLHQVVAEVSRKEEIKAM